MPTNNYYVSGSSNGMPAQNKSFIDRAPSIISAGSEYFTDANYSKNLANIIDDDYTASQLMEAAKHGINIHDRNELRRNLYNKTYRFGIMNPSESLSVGREYLFFTKPDLHLIKTLDNGSVIGYTLNPDLQDIAFFKDLYSHRKETINSLQLSINKTDPFNHLLSNQVISNLDVPALSSEIIETPVNMYGVSYSYRGSSEGSDDNPEFSLEFKDTKYLDIYTYFKAYEEYETLKHHGTVAPSKYYTVNKILHDQFCIYKFIVDEDMETIIYYGKMYGVFPKSLPRDVFSNPNFDNGISYTIDFKAAFYEDMKPDILADFNVLSAPAYNTGLYNLSPYNPHLDQADTRPAVAAYVVAEKNTPAARKSPTGIIYKLKWRGSDVI